MKKYNELTVARILSFTSDCVFDFSAWEKKKVLYQAYMDWHIKSKFIEPFPTMNMFGRILKSNFPNIESRPGVGNKSGWAGIRLKR